MGVLASQYEFGIPYTTIGQPFGKFESKFGLQPGLVLNTWDNTHFNLGIPVLLSYKLINSPRFTVGLTNNLYPSWIWASDPNDTGIRTFRTRLAAGLEMAFVTTPSRDIVLSAEVTLFDNIGDWKSTAVDTADNKIPIVWDHRGPMEILTPELTFRVGWRFLGKEWMKD